MKVKEKINKGLWLRVYFKTEKVFNSKKFSAAAVTKLTQNKLKAEVGRSVKFGSQLTLLIKNYNRRLF